MYNGQGKIHVDDTGAKPNLHAPYAAPAKATPLSGAWDKTIRCAIILGFIFIVYFTVTGRVFEPIVHAIINLHWSLMVVRPSILWASMGLLLLGFRTALWLFYRPFPEVDHADAPFITVIIPAYNEGPMV
ncbi:MAG: hypothetical protein LLG93_04255, partial [Deltaproteobacteria bacterium]|nr:hypothetical protein [Deltaproteobacteria bacterium]